MGIDTMLFTADMPADTYTAGDVIELTLQAGPTVVRDGLGLPVLKSITTGQLSNRSGSKVPMMFYAQNSNWNDPIINSPSAIADVTGMSEASGGYQGGNNCALQVNSAFTVYAVVLQTVTTTVNNSAFCTIDIEYPNIPGLQNPLGETGTPCSIDYIFESATLPATGQIATASWNEMSVDKFKAGYRYLLQKVTLGVSEGTIFYGFVRISGGANMGGLARIIPVTSYSSAVGKVITYTAPEVKGPFNIAILPSCYADTDITADVHVVCDYVKRV